MCRIFLKECRFGVVEESRSNFACGGLVSAEWPVLSEVILRRGTFDDLLISSLLSSQDTTFFSMVSSPS